MLETIRLSLSRFQNTMKSFYETVYLDGLPLQQVGIVLGAILIGLHIFALVKAGSVKGFLQKLSRHRGLGVAILTVDLIWALWLISTMHMGEFYPARPWLQTFLPLTYVLVILFVDEFLAVRALGAFLLLLACPILEAAFLQPQLSRLLLPTLCYAWILIGMFWVGMPFLLRDQINWVTKTPGRWSGACIAGASYGVAILLCAILFWGS